MSKKVKMHKNFLFYSFRHACGVPPSPLPSGTVPSRRKAVEGFMLRTFGTVCIEYCTFTIGRVSMRIFSLIAEFNPFHNGHKYLIDCARNQGAECVAAVMSGNFVQRGGCAVAGKYARAKAAVQNGVDIVLELPCIYAVSGAEYFALGGVMTINSCGVVSDIIFGSECGDIDSLRACSAMPDNAEIKARMQTGVSYPRAVHLASDSASIFRNPNDTLAVEYLRALDRLNSSITPHCVKRVGVHHDSNNQEGVFASASHIRNMIFNNDNSYKKYMPLSAAEIIQNEIDAHACPVSLTNNEKGVLTVLRQMNTEQLRAIPEVSEGLENRIADAARKSTDIESLISEIKCKRYTFARINRIITNAYIGVPDVQPNSDIGYVRVLAFNSRGREMLHMMKKTAMVPVIINARDFKKISGNAKAILDRDLKASDMYSLCLPKITKCGIDYFTGALYI